MSSNDNSGNQIEKSWKKIFKSNKEFGIAVSFFVLGIIFILLWTYVLTIFFTIIGTAIFLKSYNNAKFHMIPKSEPNKHLLDFFNGDKEKIIKIIKEKGKEGLYKILESVKIDV